MSDHDLTPVLTRLKRKLEIIRLDAKTPALSADVTELLHLVGIIEKAYVGDGKSCTDT